MTTRAMEAALAAVLIMGTTGLFAADLPPEAAAAPASEAAPPPKAGPDTLLARVYGLVNEGEKQWGAGNLPAAGDAYAAALGLLETLEAEYPGWGTHVVRSRILSCQSAIEKIRDGRPLESMKAASAATNQREDMTFALSAETAETALDALKAGIDERDETIRELRKEMRDLREANRKMAGQGRTEGKNAPEAALTVHPQVLKTEARRMLESGAITNAVALLQEMRILFPEDPTVSHLMGIAYCRQGEFEKALPEVEPLTRGKGVTSDIWMTMGVIWLGQGNLGKARGAFENAIEIEPKLAEAHYNLAQILIRLKRRNADLARRHYTTAVQLGAARDPDLEYVINQTLLDEQAEKLKKR